jgi:hypothetical protein
MCLCDWFLLSDANDGHHSPRAAAFAAVTEEQIGAAGGAQIARRNMPRLNARFDQDGAIRGE